MATVTIVGAGIAGLAAAVGLSLEGQRVTVLERRSVAGGRASSHRDEAGWIDNCQHVLLGCCTNLLSFYRELQVEGLIQFFDDFTFLDSQGKRSNWRAGLLPAPLHLATSLLRFGSLGLRDRLHVLRTLRRLSNQAPPVDEPFEAWLKRHQQSPVALECFWEPIITSALNARPSDVDCEPAFQLFRLAFLQHRDSFRIGIPVVPLSELYTGPAAVFLERHGGRLLLGESVEALVWEGDHIVEAVTRSGAYRSDYFVTAVPPRRLRKLLSERWADRTWVRNLEHFRYSPILSAHFWIQPAVFYLPFVTVLGMNLQWVFNRSRLLGLNVGNGEQHLELVVSAADHLADLPQAQVADLLWDELCCLLPSLTSNHLKRWRIIRETEATFIPESGCQALRPTAEAPEGNLALAGDWTDTGWPATMEGAAISGFRAAQALLRREGIDRKLEVPPPPAGWLARRFLI